MLNLHGRRKKRARRVPAFVRWPRRKKRARAILLGRWAGVFRLPLPLPSSAPAAGGGPHRAVFLVSFLVACCLAPFGRTRRGAPPWLFFYYHHSPAELFSLAWVRPLFVGSFFFLVVDTFWRLSHAWTVAKA